MRVGVAAFRVPAVHGPLGIAERHRARAAERTASGAVLLRLQPRYVDGEMAERLGTGGPRTWRLGAPVMQVKLCHAGTLRAARLERLCAGTLSGWYAAG